MPPIVATVVATYSRRMRLRFADGSEAEARIKGKRLKPVCGDEVLAAPINGEAEWLITSISERRNELGRPNLRGGKDVIAANLDLVVVVAAAVPAPDWFIVDRYLCAAENMPAAAAVVYNKTDLDPENSAAGALAVYGAIGYPTLESSVVDGRNIEQLAGVIGHRTAIIVGQSGVGKSALINALAPDAAQQTAEVSRKWKEGRHTTVNSVMLQLPHGGTVIDSPGVRDYAPYLETAADAAAGYREIAALAAQCRFANCRHLREPDCAVKSAVSDGSVDARRYESYRRMLATVDRIKA